MNAKKCSECGRAPVLARGLCSRCYQAWMRRRDGVPFRGPQRFRGVKVCLECGVRKAWNRGMCRPCYARWWRRHSERAPAIEEKRQRKLRYGDSATVSERIAAGCERCGMSNEQHKELYGVRLHVHHRDHNGILSGHPNHDPDNLRILCGPCHQKTHAEERKAVIA